MGWPTDSPWWCGLVAHVAPVGRCRPPAHRLGTAVESGHAYRQAHLDQQYDALFGRLVLPTDGRVLPGDRCVASAAALCLAEGLRYEQYRGLCGGRGGEFPVHRGIR